MAKLEGNTVTPKPIAQPELELPYIVSFVFSWTLHLTCIDTVTGARL